MTKGWDENYHTLGGLDGNRRRRGEFRQVGNEATVAFVAQCCRLKSPFRERKMAYQVLARKWRPRTFEEVVGQQHITRSLQNAICQSRIGHAYLLTGTRGIGKTSVARIFAKSLRCENPSENGDFCGKCAACQDSLGETSFNIYELDGASNNKVEDIRELIDGTRIMPTCGRFKVYIIDEVHMLSIAAFNALLKTLESPPTHVVFILATTAPEKLPDTILSRCQRFDFKSAGFGDIVKLMKKISEKEDIQFEKPELLDMIARQGAGSLRDALSHLDRVLCYTKDKIVREDDLVTALGLVRTGAVKLLVKNLLLGKSGTVSESVKSMLQENMAVDNIALAVLDCIYKTIDDYDNTKISSPEISLQELYWIYENLVRDMEWARTSMLPEKSLEIVLKKIALRRQFLAPRQKGNTTVVKKEEVKKKVAPISHASEQKTWQDFIKHLEKVSLVSASNLAQGNIISPVKIDNGMLSVKVGFKHSGKVFYDHLCTKEVRQKIVTYLADFFSVEVSRVSFKMEFLDHGKGTEFKSLMDIERENREQEHSLKEKTLMENPIVQKASNLFHAQVKKVQIFQEQGTE